MKLDTVLYIRLLVKILCLYSTDSVQYVIWYKRSDYKPNLLGAKMINRAKREVMMDYADSNSSSSNNSHTVTITLVLCLTPTPIITISIIVLKTTTTTTTAVTTTPDPP